MKFKRRDGFEPEAKHKDFDDDRLSIVLHDNSAVFRITPSNKAAPYAVSVPAKKLRKLAENILKELDR